jgi:arginine decarboxylase-like protein
MPPLPTNATQKQRSDQLIRLDRLVSKAAKEDLGCDLDGKGENRINDEVLDSHLLLPTRAVTPPSVVAFLLLEANSVSTCSI